MFTITISASTVRKLLVAGVVLAAVPQVNAQQQMAEPLAPHPLQYLQGAGARTGAHWRGFLEALRGALNTPARVQTACDGAVLAFEQLLRLSRRAAAREPAA